MTRAEKLRQFFLNGGSGTQKQLAKMFNTKDYVIRGYVSSLRQKNWAILNRPIAGSKETEYFLPIASKARTYKPAVNKTRYSLQRSAGIDQGRFVFKMMK